MQPPFQWDQNNLALLETKLNEFADTQKPIPMILDGFAAFKPRVIYINAIKNLELLTIEKNLSNYLQNSLNIVDPRSQNRGFSPHLTVAYRDLTKDNFRKAWLQFEHRQIYFEFIVPKLTLLIHNDKCWKIHQEFIFKVS